MPCTHRGQRFCSQHAPCDPFIQGALADSASLSSCPTSKLCKALLRCFDNRTESCRDMAVSSCSRLLQLDPDATLGLLPYVLPVLMERLQCDEVMTHAAFWWHTQQNVSCMAKLCSCFNDSRSCLHQVPVITLALLPLSTMLSTPTSPNCQGGFSLDQVLAGECSPLYFPAVLQSHNPTEPSEEVRMQLVQLLSLILDQAGTAIAAYASEVWAMLTAILVDIYHEVAMLGCKVSQQLAGG